VEYKEGIVEYGALSIWRIEEWSCNCVCWMKKDKQKWLLWQLGIEIGGLLPSSISSSHLCWIENV